MEINITSTFFDVFKKLKKLTYFNIWKLIDNKI